MRVASAPVDEAVDCLTSFASVAGVLTNKVVVVHPIVLLSVVDHFTRVAKGTTRRVVGCVLGEVVDNELRATNSFAVPFDEDHRDSRVWFLDEDYLEKLYRMFNKVNALERVIGWYSTGRSAKPQDLHIHEIFRKFTPDPVYLIIDVEPQHSVVPALAYCSYEEPTSDFDFRRSFVHVACTVGAFEAEEVGVEHLLRDLKNATTSTLATRVEAKLEGLRLLGLRLKEISDYLADVCEEKLPLNPNVLYTIQEIFNLLPDMQQPQLLRAFATQTNDSMLALYLASVVRVVMALHNLIDNKLLNKRDSEKKEREAAAAEEAREKAAKEEQNSTKTNAPETDDSSKA